MAWCRRAVWVVPHPSFRWVCGVRWWLLASFPCGVAVCAVQWRPGVVVVCGGCTSCSLAGLCRLPLLSTVALASFRSLYRSLS